MLSRLVEANYFSNRLKPTPQQVEFWLRELRNPSLLLEVFGRFPEQRAQLLEERPLLRHSQPEELQSCLWEEERLERERDRKYWQPLRAELEQLRRERARTVESD